MVSLVLLHKVRRDLWRQRWQFLATAIIIAIGVAVYVAASDAYANLKQSFDRAYAVQMLPDAVLTGAGLHALRDEAGRLPGDPVLATRQQGDIGIRIKDNTFYGRVVEIPAARQPAVSQLALRTGAWPAGGEVLVEEHLAEHYGLGPGDTIEVLSPTGWRSFSVTGSGLSSEYFWPARSEQEIMTNPEHFGVVFMTATDVQQTVTEPSDQLLLYARDRLQASALVDAAAQLARVHDLVFVSRERQPSYRALEDDVDSVGTFSNLLPWVFLVAAVLGTYVLLSRLVSGQRAVIGTLGANGLTAAQVSRHYLVYGIAVGGAGAAIGTVGGYFLGGWFTTQYTRALGLPLQVVSLHPTHLIIGVAVGTAAAVVAAWAPARAASRMSPAEAMRISPPVTRGGISLIERVLPPLRRLPARWRMMLRGIARNRRRSILTIAGVMIAVCLVMVFAGLRDTVDSVINRQFGDIELQDAQVMVARGAADSVTTTLRTHPDVAAAEAFTRLDASVEAHDRRYETLLIALPQATQMHRFASGRTELALPQDGVLLGSGLREVLDIDVGDTLTITANGIRVAERVGGFTDEPMSPVVYVSREQMAGLAPASGVMIRLAPNASETAVRHFTMALPGAVAYLSTASLRATLHEAFSLYDALVGLMLLFGGVMAAALLYNAMSANIGERTGELGSLQAAGISAGSLGRLVAAENLLLVMIALPLGLAAGRWLADWFMSRYETQGFRWHLDLQSSTLVVVAVAVLAAALLAQAPAFRVIGRMDVAKVVRERSL